MINNAKLNYFLLILSLIFYCFGESARFLSFPIFGNRSIGVLFQILLIISVFLFIKKINLFYFKYYIYFSIFFITSCISVLLSSFNNWEN